MDKLNHGIEEQTQEQPLIEEPEDQEPDPQPEEYPQAAPDFASEKANPSEEGMEFLFVPRVGGGTLSSGVRSVLTANEVTSVGMMLLYFASLLVIMNYDG
ncbi:hypothetical protein U9M48_028831 [Paspalum notatum var. saurae]|uniref:Uncharacterized protein n=1 Tax=Paspalum notatum var. saurae TaxID=547442 RepID=A0AAQ3X1F4_PASNO